MLDIHTKVYDLDFYILKRHKPASAKKNICGKRWNTPFNNLTVKKLILLQTQNRMMQGQKIGSKTRQSKIVEWLMK